MARLPLPSETPAWMLAFARAIEAALREPRLPEYLSTALPDPVAGRARQIIVTDLAATAWSNGTAWIRTDTGAII